MESELFGEEAIASTFANGRFTMDSDKFTMDDVDVDMNLLNNWLEAHTLGLGLPTGPAAALLAQMGIALPKPPSASQT